MKNRKKLKFNLVDVLIIIGIILAAAMCVYVLSSLKDTGSGSAADNVKMRYSVEFKKKEKTVVDAFEAAAERGDSCFVSEKEKAAATLKEVIAVPAKKATTNLETGEALFSDIEDKYDVTVVLESEGTETDKDILADGKAPIKVGDEISVKGKGYAGYGFITSLELVD